MWLPLAIIITASTGVYLSGSTYAALLFYDCVLVFLALSWLGGRSKIYVNEEDVRE